MRKLLIIALLIVGCVFAQEFDLSVLNNTEKMILYTSEKKNPAAAVILECLLPTSGYGYSENWSTGFGH